MVRQRRQQASDLSATASSPDTATAKPSTRRTMNTDAVPEQQPLVGQQSADAAASLTASPATSTLLQRNQWIALALASGACAAFNGVFAKLTTTELTTSLSQAVARIIGLDAAEAAVELVVRGTFFALNLVFNGVMWTLFTRALKAGHSATQVSIMNTSANFVLTALLGLAIFSESLPPLWWAGASLLVAGNVIIGRKDEGQTEEQTTGATSLSSDLPADDADEAAVAATTVSAAAATIGANKSASIETPSSKGRRSSRRLAAQREHAEDSSE
ncbi:hypothetical protein SEUCBS139899_006194 [Sporothrix eucalyptigena]|uniref:Transmembrane protein 42 n=1 Tax=Sporothrix eucalyptigena TaxID=1812306 RepID=A0ABP0AQ97_9PEZI